MANREKEIGRLLTLGNQDTLKSSKNQQEYSEWTGPEGTNEVLVGWLHYDPREGNNQVDVTSQHTSSLAGMHNTPYPLLFMVLGGIVTGEECFTERVVGFLFSALVGGEVGTFK